MSEDCESATRHCLDLFAGLGGFSQAFEADDNWEVTTLDINPEFDPDIKADIMAVEPDELPDADVVLASPPCQRFSVACITNMWDHSLDRQPRHLPERADIADHVAVVFRTMWLVRELQPRYWIMENPQGMLRKWIGPPTGQVHYCQYGADFKKPTDLWGRHPPMNYRHCPGQTQCGHVQNARDVNTFRDESRARAADSSNSAERAKVPYELSATVLDAVEAAIEDPPPEQSTLQEVGADV